jgi:hypothetical protein
LLFIPESIRQRNGVADDRFSKFALEDDLQLQSVEDRLKLYESGRLSAMAEWTAAVLEG